MTYRSFCYTDWLNEFMTNPAPMKSEYVDLLVEEVAQGGADVLMYSPNGQTVVYPSDVWPGMWDRLDDDPAAAFGTLANDPDERVEEHEVVVRQMRDYALAGNDILSQITQSCRRRNLASGISVRMNDTHGYQWGRCYLISDFYYDNPHLRVESPYITLNYEHKEVRDHYHALIEELVHRYSFNVLDLDFVRNPFCLPPGRGRELSHVMTDFIATVRDLLRSSGKDIQLLLRLPGAPDTSMYYGFNAGEIVDRQLADGIAIAYHLHGTWSAPVQAWREITGDTVALYTCGDYFADTREGLPDRILGLEPELMRGLAASSLAAGADGVYWFNFVCARQAKTVRLMDKPAERDQCRPCFEVTGQSDSLETLSKYPCIYEPYSATRHIGGYDPPCALPVSVLAQQSRAIEICIAPVPAHAKVTAVVTARTDNKILPGQLLLRTVNNHELLLQGVVSDLDGHHRTITWDVPTELLPGCTVDLCVYNAGTSAIHVVGVELHMDPNT